MTHAQKIDRLIVEMKQKGVSLNTIAPPLFQLFWKLGWNVKPPVFMSFVTLTLLHGIFFSVVWGVLFWWIWQWLVGPAPLGVVVGASIAGGLMFGIMMALQFRKKAKKLGLSDWNSYPEQTSGSEP